MTGDDRAVAGATGPTATLAAFAATLRFDAMTESERAAARRHLLDTLGACIAGSASEAARLAAEVVEDALPGSGEVAVAGRARGYDALSAAYLMGTAAHGLEVDDGYRAGSVHPGCVVVPALLAAAAAAPCDGRRLTAALAAGYEVAARVAEAIHPQSRQRGFHNTAVVGPLAAAAAVCSLRGDDAALVEHALGLAASASAGLFAFLHGGGEVKRIHPGHAAREGLFAARLAGRGLAGPRGVLEGRDGIFQAFSSPQAAADRFRLPRRPDEPLAVARCYLKPYACCRHLHAAVDGLREVMAEEMLTADAVVAIEVGTYAIAAEHAHTGWDDMGSAQMSFPYCMALALEGRPLDVEDFAPPARRSPSRAAAARLLAVAVDPECEASYPRLRSARVRVRTRSGAVHERFVREPYGAPDRPMDAAEVAAKFRRLAAPILGQAGAARVVTLVEGLDSLASTADLAAALTVPGAQSRRLPA